MINQRNCISGVCGAFGRCCNCHWRWLSEAQAEDYPGQISWSSSPPAASCGCVRAQLCSRAYGLALGLKVAAGARREIMHSHSFGQAALGSRQQAYPLTSQLKCQEMELATRTTTIATANYQLPTGNWKLSSGKWQLPLATASVMRILAGLSNDSIWLTDSVWLPRRTRCAHIKRMRVIN